jgi:hypothetical protein
VPSGFGTTKTKYYRLSGGLDVVTPALSIPPGRCLAMLNFEPFYNGGYRRCDGFERFDGRPKPSDATFVGFTVDDNTYFSVGDNVIGSSSGATGVICGVSGDWVGVTKVVGDFEEGELLNGVVEVTSEPESLGAEDQDMEDEFLLGAQDEYRDDIQPVPGEGPVRGIWQRGETVYAVRNDDDSAGQAILHRSSASGWTTSGITMCWYLFFDGGGGGSAQALPAEGTTINGQTSGATAVVHRVVEHGGATGTNDAYGYLVLRSVTGNFQNNENLRVSTTKFADSASVHARFALPAGGTYRFVNHNFYGGADTYRTYGVNGVGPAFEIDEDHYVSPLLLPLTAEEDQPPANTPHLIAEHKNYLFLAFPGGSLVHTVVGDPLVVNGFLGSAEFGIGAEMTGLHSEAGNVLIITTEKFTRGLYGSDTSDWDMKPIGKNIGGKQNAVRQLDTVYSLDDLGITSLSRVQAFGDFTGATLSQLVQPIVKQMRTQITDSTVVRGSNQFRVYFEDGSALVMYVKAAGSESPASTAGVEFGFLSYPFAVNRIYNSEDETDQERTYFATDDEEGEGLVYEDQIGTSFDGEAIASYLRLAFNHVGSPAWRKKFRRLDVELTTTRQLDLRIVQDLSYGSEESSSGQTNLVSNDIDQTDVFGGGGFWNSSQWDEFQWDGQSLSNARAPLSGTGENIGFVIFNESAVADSFILQGLTVHYDIRRLQR